MPAAWLLLSSDPVRTRLAAVGDLHYSKTATAQWQPFFSRMAEQADVVLLCGDLTDYGLPEEAQALARDLQAAVRIPMVAVLGNHDYEAGRQDEIRGLLQQVGAFVLDGETCEVRGIGFAGAKGFAGGFGRGTLGPWGEPVIKAFVREAVDEAMKLETALARLRTPQRVVVLHYAPVQATVEGEPREIFPFLGTSRLEEPLDRLAATLVFHGHAHNGAPEGRTAGRVPVYNVSLPLLRRLSPDRPFRLVTLDDAT